MDGRTRGISGDPDMAGRVGDAFAHASWHGQYRGDAALWIRHVVTCADWSGGPASFGPSYVVGRIKALWLACLRRAKIDREEENDSE